MLLKLYFLNKYNNLWLKKKEYSKKNKDIYLIVNLKFTRKLSGSIVKLNSP